VTLPLDVKVTAELEYRRAESSCCRAGLAGRSGDDMPAWQCRECGRPCLRVLGDPVKVEAHG
jgi:hypothetical protein